MNDTVKTLLNHRSVRKYKTDTIDDRLLDQILETGIRASNTGNMQVYSIIITKSQQKKNELLPLHFNQSMVQQAPVVLTFCADINRFNKWCKARNAEPAYDNFLWFMNATIDTLLAAQNVCVAAESHGLGICYLGTTTYNAEGIINVLGLPKGVVPVTTVVLGYPDETPELTNRLPFEAVIHHETYQDFNTDMINDLYQLKESLEETKKLVEENKTENLAQIFTDKRYVKSTNVKFSNDYLNVLRKQGFMNQ